MDDYLAASGQTPSSSRHEFTDSARRSVKAGFVLDQLARTKS